jgi:hypothetical protein
VKAGKAYISSLGTTGLLIASSVLLLAVVGTFVAFDRWPTGSSPGAENVAIGGADRVHPARKVVAERRSARAERRRAAARARVARARARATRARRSKDANSSLPTGQVVSGLPAPDSDPLGGGPMGGGAGGGGGVGTRASPGTAGDGSAGGDPARHVGDAVSQVGSGPHDTVGQLGQAVDQAIGQSDGPPVP